MKQFRLVDNLMGWITFAIAAFVYCSTIEPTASFWDCPEFITTAYKLEVGHPPGAPFFMLTANLFTQFVSDPALVARMVNTMSALFSAACIMFLFWSISHLGLKLVGENGQLKNMAQLITVEASALTGALVYTFSDTFWFSAVEGEVYAYSSLFTAVVFWLMLKWEDHADEPGSDRWLILSAYLMGLSGNYVSVSFSDVRVSVKVNNASVENGWLSKFDKTGTFTVSATAKSGYTVKSVKKSKSDHISTGLKPSRRKAVLSQTMVCFVASSSNIESILGCVGMPNDLPISSTMGDAARRSHNASSIWVKLGRK